MPQDEKPLSDIEKSDQTVESNIFSREIFFNQFIPDLELEQKKQVLTNIASFIREQVDLSENTLEISLNAACFLCQEEDSRLHTEETPSQQTQRVIDAVQECLIAVNVHYENLSDCESWLRITEILSIRASAKNPTVTQIKEEINWDSLPSNIRKPFLKENKRKVSFNLYSPQE